MNMKNYFFLHLLLLFQFVNCQEESLFDCSSNYYRDEDSVCQLCDEDACKILLQNKNTKYESCQGFCSSKTDPKQYVTSTITRHPKTTRQKKLPQKSRQLLDKSWVEPTWEDLDIPQSNNRPVISSPGFLPIVIIVIIGVLVSGTVRIMSIMICCYQQKKKNRRPINPISSTSNPLMAVRIPENDDETSLYSSCSIDSTKTPLMDGKSPENDNDNETSTMSGYPNERIKTPVKKLRMPDIIRISRTALPSWMKTGQKYTAARPESGYPNDSAKTPV